jgi:MinD superfamily P-loop ATPase
MVEIIAITGGKGGTGKSTVATALAHELSKNNSVLLVDADVDCPNDHLLLNLELQEFKLVKQRIPKINESKCNKCGKCGNVCKSKALISLKNIKPIFIKEQCNGCGSCYIICPEKAITWQNKEIGKLYKSKKDNLHLLTGELKANEPISEFIVNWLNEEIIAVKENYDYIIIDTAAGTHCPVIAAFEFANKVIAVTEPTPLGLHDLKIILKLLKILKKESSIVVNRHDIGNIKLIEDVSEEFNVNIIFKIPYSKKIVKSYSEGEIINIPNILQVIEK